MNKKTIMKILLFAVPFMAFVFATTNNSVQLVNTLTGETQYGSYFTMLGESAAAICPFLAALCSISAMVFSALYLFRKKKGFLKTTTWSGFAGACIAVIPVAARGEVLLLPNVIFPILMMIHFFICAFSKNLKLDEKDENHGPRLERH